MVITSLPKRYPISTGLAALYLVMLAGVLGFSPLVLTLNPWFGDVVDALSRVIPMIDRVTRYGHPHPEKLRALLALGWIASGPTVGVAIAIQWLRACRDGQQIGPDDPWTGISLGVPLAGFQFWFMVYWPFMRGTSLTITIAPDVRRRMFMDDLGVMTTFPLVLAAAHVSLLLIFAISHSSYKKLDNSKKEIK